MAGKNELIQQLDSARAKMQAIMAELDLQTEIYPDWTIKHILAHIAGWDDASIASLRAHKSGKEPATPAVRGIDHYNAESVATREALSYEQIIREWEMAREQLKAIINEMSPEKFEEPMLFAWGETGSVAQLVAIFAEHEEEHAKEIKALLDQLAEA
jgi:hypothetical protein